MDLNLLYPDELDVECRVRNLRGTPTDVLFQLENAIKLEEGIPSIRPYKMHLDARKKPKHELKKCSTKLSEIKTELESLAPAEKINVQVLRQVETRLIHLCSRLGRAQSSPKYGKLATGLLDTSRTLLLKVQSIMQDETELEKTLVELRALQFEKPGDLSESEDEGEIAVFVYPRMSGELDDRNSTPVVNASDFSQQHDQRLDTTESNLLNAGPSKFNLPPQHNQESGGSLNDQHKPNSGRKYMSDSRTLARSGISYDGSATAMPIDLFIFQLETLAKSLNLADELLFTEVCFVLKGNALRFYWTYRRSNPTATWFIFRNDLIQRFKDKRTEFELRRLVESRKQNPKESFLNFYNDVWTLTLQCRKPYSEEDLLDVLRFNMIPALQMHLTDKSFDTVQDLIKSATSWETTWARLGINPENLVPSRRSNIHELQITENDASSSSPSHDQSCISATIPQLETIQQVAPILNRSNLKPNSVTFRDNQNHYSVCYNCDDMGHTFHQCSEPRTRFCYKCGYKGVTVPSCPTCSGNAQRDRTLSGDVRLLQKPTWRSQKNDSASNTDPDLYQSYHGSGKLNQ